MVMLNLEEAATYLGRSPEDVKKLAQRGDIEAYNIGGVYLRFKKDHLIRFKEKLEPKEPLPGPLKNSFLNNHIKSISDDKPSLMERICDFWYFNNFYIISLGIIVALMVMILK